jgi:AraC family transcriptional regulator
MPTATPAQWAERLSRPPDLRAAAHGVELCAWSGTSPVMPQPRLDRHYIVMHLGGAKRVTRSREGPTRCVDVPRDGITIVPEGSRFDWVTEGPIAFAHLYLPPRLLGAAADRIARADPRTFDLPDAIGLDRPALVAPMRQLLACAAAAETGLAFEAGLEALFAGLIDTAGTGLRDSARIRLSRPRLKRVLDLVEDRLAEPLSLATLADAAGLSPFHFARCFRAQTGRTPHAHLTARRMVHARHLLCTTDLPVDEVARACGYRSHSRFTATFHRHVRSSPSQWRRS